MENERTPPVCTPAATNRRTTARPRHRFGPVALVAACILLAGAGCGVPQSIETAGARLQGRPSTARPPGASVSALAHGGHSAMGPTALAGTTPALDTPYVRSSYLGALTFNMQHRDNPDQLAVMARHLRSDLQRLPDFILCQEVLFERARWKGRDNTAAVLGDLLGYDSRGTKRKSDREGVAILSRYPFAYYSERHLKARTTGLLLGFRRVSVMGEFLIPDVGRVRVVNVHFAHWPFEHHIRRKQLEETLAWLADRQRKVRADVTILGGDFNIRPQWKELELVTRPRGRNAMHFVNANSRQPTRGGKGRPSERIDYIFISAPTRDIAIEDEQLLWRDGLRAHARATRFWLSDHVPLLHEYVVGPRTVATNR